jgi:methylenetetrahydrofolate--tRNA-(uracil-5-)-methyltransferase
VDRVLFSRYITEKIRECPNIEVIGQEMDRVQEGEITVIATGPLTSDPMADYIQNELGCDGLHFFDAAAPIVDYASINMDVAYFASRYDKGTADYINCPMNKEQYLAFVEALKTAKEAPVHGFEDKAVFEGCMPVEVMARRGEDTLRFGPMKPVGLTDPRTGERPYAVVQLRADNAEKTAFNIVGFQTHLMHPEQKRVFGMIPALKNAEYFRYGTMHRNSFIRSPGRLDRHYRVIGREELFFAGQITGVEGYIESTASGLCCGINMARQLRGKEPLEFPHETALGALSMHVSQDPELRFDPMNINFGIIKGLDTRIRNKQERYTATSLRALDMLEELKDKLEEGIE